MLNLNNLNTGYKNEDNNFVISSNYDLLNTDNINVRWDQNKILITRPYGLSNLSKIQFRDFNGDLLPFTSLQLPKLKADVCLIQNQGLSKVEFKGFDNFYISKDFEYNTKNNVIFTIDKDWTYNEDSENQIISNIQELIKLIEIRMQAWWGVGKTLTLGDNPIKSVYDKQLITTLNNSFVPGFHSLAMYLNGGKMSLIGAGGNMSLRPYSPNSVAISSNDDDSMLYSAALSNGGLLIQINYAGGITILYQAASSNMQHDNFHSNPNAFSSCFASLDKYRTCLCEVPDASYPITKTQLAWFVLDHSNNSELINETLDINYYTQFTHGFQAYNVHCLGCALNKEPGDILSVIMLVGVSSYNNPNQMRFFVLKHIHGTGSNVFTTIGYSKSYITLSYWNNWKYGNFMLTQYGNNNFKGLLEAGRFQGNEFYAIDLGGLVCYGTCSVDSKNKPYFLFTYPVGYHYLRKYDNTTYLTIKQYNGVEYWGPISINDYPTPDKYEIIEGNPEEMAIISNDINTVPYSLFNTPGIIYVENGQIYSNGGLMDVETQITNIKIYPFNESGAAIDLAHGKSGNMPTIDNFNFDSNITEQDGILTGTIKTNQISFVNCGLLMGIRIYTEPFTFELTTAFGWNTAPAYTIQGITENINFISLSPKTLLTLEMLILLQYEFNDVELKVSGFQNTDNIIFHINETSRVRFKEMTCSDTLTQLIITLTDQRGEQLDKDSLKAIYGKLNLSIDWVQ